jgi:hypothetical protein
MEVSVDTHDRAGDRLPKIAHSGAAYETHAFASMDELADRRVAQIIAANSGEVLPSMARRESGSFSAAGVTRPQARPRAPVL